MISVVDWDSRSDRVTLIGTPEQWEAARWRIASISEQSAQTRDRLTTQIDAAMVIGSYALIRLTMTTYDAALIMKRE